MKNTLYALLLAIAALLFTGCRQAEPKSTATISGRLTAGSQKAYLATVSDLAEQRIDSVELSATGEFRFEIKGAEKEHRLYNIICGTERIALFVAAGDDISVTPNATGAYAIEGSEESQLLAAYAKAHAEGCRELNILLKEYATAKGSRQTALAKRYNELRAALKREQLAFISSHKSNLAAIYALYQRLPGESYLIDEQRDLIHYRDVAEAVAERYASSPYLTRLNKDVRQMENRTELQKKIVVRTHPDITAADMYGNKQSLSSLDGCVTLLYFWSAAAGNSNAINADLKQTYATYAERGFKVYQISVDTSRATWINAVQEQQLPWVSVCDTRGEASPALGIYNVTRLPASFLFDAQGNVVAKDIFGTELDKKLAKMFK